MSRKSTYINKLTSKDQDMLRAFRATGYLSVSHLKEELFQADKRIANFCRDAYLEKCSILNKSEKIVEDVYRLTDKGKELCLTQLGMCNFYRSSSASHDLALADEYFELTYDQRLSWLTESDLRERFEELCQRVEDEGDIARADEMRQAFANGKISACDGAYSNGNTTVAVEIVTDNYGVAEISAKESFCEIMSLNSSMYRI